MGKIYFIIQLSNEHPPQTGMMSDSQIITEAEHFFSNNYLVTLNRAKVFFGNDDEECCLRRAITDEEYMCFCIDVIIEMYKSKGIRLFFYNANSDQDDYLFNARYYEIEGEALELIGLAENELKWISITESFTFLLNGDTQD